MAIKMINGAEFLHVPKTGGSWIYSVLESNNLVLSSIGHKHADFDFSLFPDRSLSGREHILKAYQLLRYKFSTKNKAQFEQPFKFCFVRNPLNWYESWWKYMEGRNWNNWGEVNSAKNWHPNSVLNGLGSSDFNEFIWNVIKERPGYVTELFFSYTKAGISFIGRYENLRQDLYDVLNILNFNIDHESLMNSQKVNVSKVLSSEVEWDPMLKETITKLELPAMIHFGYLNKDEQHELGVHKYISPNRKLHK